MRNFYDCHEKPTKDKPTEKGRLACEDLVRKSSVAWNEAETFTEVKLVFRDVALGKLYSPFYSELLSSPAEDNQDMPQFNEKFAELQMLGFLTDNSQFEDYSDQVSLKGEQYKQIQKAFITGYMPAELAEFVCGKVNRRPDMVAYVRDFTSIPTFCFPERPANTMLGVTFEGDSLHPYTTMNVAKEPYLDIVGWCHNFNKIIDEENLVYVTLINVNYHAPMGALLDFTLETLKEFHKEFHKAFPK